MKKFQKGSGVTSEITTRLKKAITSVDGDQTLNESMNSWITNYFQGTHALREYLREITPDVDMSFQFVSELTGKLHDMDIPLNVEFFF